PPPPGDDTPGDDGDKPVPPANSWQADQVYTKGDRVTYQSKTYEAKWWTRGDEPGKDQWGPWKQVQGSDNPPPTKPGDGDKPDTDKPGNGDKPGDNGKPDDSTPSNAAPWQADKVYVKGDLASYQHTVYQAKWWTRGDEPGADQWGPWEAKGNKPTPPDDGDKPKPPKPGDGDKPGDGYVIPLSKLKAREAELTNTDLMKNVKASIATLDNELVEKIAPGNATNPANVKRVESIIGSDGWDFLFPKRAKEYTYTNFLKAIGKFPAFCGNYDDGRDADAICRKSLATMFAHFTQETGAHEAYMDVPEWRQGLHYVREMGWTEDKRGGYNAECSPDTWQGKTWPCGKFADGQYKSYFGRGAKQLSYNYNYGPFSEAMFGTVRTLLDNPEKVADTWLNLASAVFFYVYPQPPKPSMFHVINGTWQPNAHDKEGGLVHGFGVTTQIINGGVECGGPTEHRQSQNRINYYKQFTQYLKVPIADDEVLGCANMKRFDTKGSGALNIYWEQDWSWDPSTPSGKSYKCKLVNYQTPFSAFKQGDYVKCIEHFFDDVVIDSKK
uniref:glycoside hydrolase family 19 protein n=1 Tax=Zooshikella ganghwensis TaxID=202772 RepID=UPI0012F77E88